jgi:hypothetical protein
MNHFEVIIIHSQRLSLSPVSRVLSAKPSKPCQEHALAVFWSY